MDKRQLVFLPRKPFSPFSKKIFFFLLTLRWPEMPFFGGETFPPPQDGEIEAAIFVAVPFFFFFEIFHECRVSRQTGGKRS